MPESLFNKVAGLRPQVFTCEFCEIFKNTFFYRTPPIATSAASILPCMVFISKIYGLFTRKQSRKDVLQKSCSEKSSFSKVACNFTKGEESNAGVSLEIYEMF